MILISSITAIFIFRSYLLVLVERVDDEFHHAAHVRLELMLLSLVSKLLALLCTKSIQLDGLSRKKYISKTIKRNIIIRG
jgi:hypothetical protein